MSDNLKLHLIETSKIFEEKIKREPENPNVKKALNEFKKGNLFDPQFAYEIVKERILEIIKTQKQYNGFIFNGSPRTVYEAKKLSSFLIKTFNKNNIFVFYLNVSLQTATKRLLSRKICSSCKRPINPNLIAANPQLDYCNLCGGKLIKRPIDTADIIKTRFTVYQKRTHPVLKFLEKKGFNIHHIKGEQKIENVYNQITSQLKI